MKKLLFVLLLLTSFTFVLKAQIINEFKVGLVLPQGDFADDDEDDFLYDGSGIAGTGFNLGYKAIIPLSDNGLYWTVNAGFMYNALQKDYKDDVDDDYSDVVDEYSLPKYINIPILVGFQYEAPLSDDVNIYGEGSLGINFFKITKYSVEYENGNEFLETYDLSTKLGYKIGAGVIIQDQYTISLNYMGLGSHKVKYEYEYEYSGASYDDDDKFNKALSVSSLNITFGYRF